MSTKSIGVTDWYRKREIIRKVLGIFIDRELYREVLSGSGRAGPSFATEVDKLHDRARRWDEHKPQMDREFFDLLARKLGCKSIVTGLAIVEASIEDFIEMLPHQAREKAGVATSSLVAGGTDARSPVSTDSIINLCHMDDIQSVSSGVRSGLLDTRHYYSTADAAETWSRLVSAYEYPTYDHCKAGLWKLMEDPDWQKVVASNTPTYAIMLAGGGSPTKDLILLKSILDRTSAAASAITMVLVDINPHMLIQSMSLLKRMKPEIHGHERTTILYIQGDVYKLGDLQMVDALQSFFNRKEPAIFAITGGTIGNLGERKFFESLNTIIRSGDLLIVSADTTDGIEPEKLQAELTKKYNHLAMHRFVSPGVEAVINEFKLQESTHKVLKRVKVRVTPDADGKLSDVPKGLGVTLMLTVGDREVTLLSSTRYSASALTDFAVGFGWELICKVPSPYNEHFAQFAFRRK